MWDVVVLVSASEGIHYFNAKNNRSDHSVAFVQELKEVNYKNIQSRTTIRHKNKEATTH